MNITRDLQDRILASKNIYRFSRSTIINDQILLSNLIFNCPPASHAHAHNMEIHRTKSRFQLRWQQKINKKGWQNSHFRPIWSSNFGGPLLKENELAREDRFSTVVTTAPGFSVWFLVFMSLVTFFKPVNIFMEYTQGSPVTPEYRLWTEKA